MRIVSPSFMRGREEVLEIELVEEDDKTMFIASSSTIEADDASDDDKSVFGVCGIIFLLYFLHTIHKCVVVILTGFQSHLYSSSSPSSSSSSSS